MVRCKPTMSRPAHDPPRAEAASEESRTAWTRYWQAGALHSCATSFAGNYEGPIADFWRRVFGGLAAGERVLDIACGNGPLAKLLIETRPEPSITCDCVDLAPVAPAWVGTLPPVQRGRVRFFGDTRAEALPFERGSFALAVSQFGLEYSALAESVPEILRVLARPSRLAAVVHHVESHPVRLAAEELRHVQWALQAEGLVASAGAMLRPMAQAGTEAGRRALAADTAALRLRDRFNAQQRELTDRAAASSCPDLLFELRTAIASALEIARARGEAAGRNALRGIEQAVRDDRARLADMQAAAMDAARLHSTLERLGDRARREVAPIEHAGHLMGWSVLVSLPASG
jgi:SAM-dependent methyltransferase